MKYIIQHAEHNKLEENFIHWVKNACYFYDTLVDRIVPGFPKENIDDIKKELDFNDNLVVKGEYFHVWAIGGDSRIENILPLHRAGLNVLFMDDIRDFRAKKVRILNGSHTAMVPIALQMGCSTVMDAFSTSIIEQFINKMVYEEVLPAIDDDPEELKSFATKIIERFYNPYLKHYLKDISLNSLSKWETRNFPTVKDYYANSKKLAALTSFSFAALLVLYSNKSQVQFTPNDTDEFVDFIQSSFDENNIKEWVEGVVYNKRMWKEDFHSIPGFVDSVSENVNVILKNGMENALKNLV